MKEFTRDFVNLSERKFRLQIEEDDMDGLFVELNGFANKDAEEPEIEILYCTIYDGADEADSIFEEFEDCIQWIEKGSYEVSNLIEIIREHYISGEYEVPYDVGWRAPGDTDGEDFDKHCRWTEEDDFKGYDELLDAVKLDVADESGKIISKNILDFIEAAYQGNPVEEPLKITLQSLCAYSDAEIPKKTMKMGLQCADEIKKIASKRPFEHILFADMFMGDHRFRDEVANYLKTALESSGIHVCHPFVKDKQACWNSDKRCAHCRVKEEDNKIIWEKQGD